MRQMGRKSPPEISPYSPSGSQSAPRAALPPAPPPPESSSPMSSGSSWGCPTRCSPRRPPPPPPPPALGSEGTARSSRSTTVGSTMVKLRGVRLSLTTLRGGGEGGGEGGYYESSDPDSYAAACSPLAQHHY